MTADCVKYSLPCPANFNTGQPLSAALKPFPFQAVTDGFGQYMGNANYNALQLLLNMRSWHGLTTNLNYTWGRAIDDAGFFRTGYAIPAGTIAGAPSATYKADEIERSISTSNQPHHFVATSVWNWPFGKSVLAENPVERAILGGFTFSGVYQALLRLAAGNYGGVMPDQPGTGQQLLPGIHGVRFYRRGSSQRKVG